jgi:hypothetical protein
MKRGRRILIGALICLQAFFGVRLSAFAQQTQSGRIADCVSPSLLSSGAKPQTVADAGAGTRKSPEREIVATPSSSSTAGDRWVEFEREYGVHQKSSSWFLSMLQSAKYGIDKITFGAKETAKRLEFTYDIGSPSGPGGTTSKPQYSLPLFGAFGQPQLKTVLTEHDPQTGTPFVGLKLSIPFGEND